MIPNLSTLSLRNLAELGDNVAMPMYLREFDEDEWEKHTHKGEVVPTLQYPDKVAATEIERSWLRQHYGNDWSKAALLLRRRMIMQARHACSFAIAPKIIEGIEAEEAAATKEWNATHLRDDGSPKIDWASDVMPALQAKYPPDWRKGPDGAWLTQDGKDARANEVKAELRAARLSLVEPQRAEYAKARVEARVEKIMEELNYPDRTLKRKSRALCRHWWNRNGRSGEPRKWFADANNDVPDAVGTARLNWATEQVQMETYDPSNPPRPPQKLYLPLDVWIYESWMPDRVEAISSEGGQWLWKFMRTLEAMNFEATANYAGEELASVDTSAQYWTPAFRAAQRLRIEGEYKEFIESVDEMSEIPYAKGTAYSYTEGSGKFNKYLLWPAAAVGSDPANIPSYGAGVGGVAGSTDSGVIGPPDALHRLYKLINRCPRVGALSVFLRAARRPSDLPHNLGKSELVTPVVGRGYLNVTFMSTSSADPNQYTDGPLSTFYNNDSTCCMYAITAPKGTPVLPLVLGGTTNSAYASEQEVVLPPGLVLIYQGARTLPVGNGMTDVHFYQAARPHVEDGKQPV